MNGYAQENSHVSQCNKCKLPRSPRKRNVKNKNTHTFNKPPARLIPFRQVPAVEYLIFHKKSIARILSRNTHATNSLTRFVADLFQLSVRRYGGCGVFSFQQHDRHELKISEIPLIDNLLPQTTTTLFNSALM